MTERVYAGQTIPLTLTGERTLPGIAVENYWFPVTQQRTTPPRTPGRP